MSVNILNNEKDEVEQRKFVEEIDEDDVVETEDQQANQE